MGHPSHTLRVMARAQSICSLCTYGVAYTRIQNIGMEKEREGKREEKKEERNTLTGRESGKGWQNGRCRAMTVLVSL